MLAAIQITTTYHTQAGRALIRSLTRREKETDPEDVMFVQCCGINELESLALIYAIASEINTGKTQSVTDMLNQIKFLSKECHEDTESYKDES